MPDNPTRVLVTGAAGFIGRHLCAYLRQRGYWVRGVDLAEAWNHDHITLSSADGLNLLSSEEWRGVDLRIGYRAQQLVSGVDEVYHLAADFGGMGYIAEHRADVMTNNTRIDLNVLEAARSAGVKRFLYASSACVYPEGRQTDPNCSGLVEDEAWPAQPDTAYGLAKLYGEELCRHYRRDYGIETRIARLHNVYGPHSQWDGGREKAPAALCRKVATAKLTGSSEIEVWGDGEQTRSFLYIDDCLEGLHRLMRSDYAEPVNIGSEELVSINELATQIGCLAGFGVERPLTIKHVPGPQGVRGRNADLMRAREVLGWQPETRLIVGLLRTYNWVEEQVAARLAEEQEVKG
jgi:GDP-D-mannose 3',5'-epimerase